jgi:hypothetical protein
MSPAMIGFFFGVVVGGLGGIFLTGLLFLVRERKNQGEEILEMGEDFPIPAAAETRLSDSAAMRPQREVLWGARGLSCVAQIHKDLKA